MSSKNPCGNDSSGTDYEHLARGNAAALLHQGRVDTEEAITRIEDLLYCTGAGTVTADDVLEARAAIAELEQTLEENVVPLVDGVESYERSGAHLPYSRVDELTHCDCTEDSE